MADKRVAQVADDERNDDADTCPDCGGPMRHMTEEEMYDERLELIQDILGDINPIDGLMLLGSLAGDYIGRFRTTAARRDMREWLMQTVDDNTKMMLELFRQKKREADVVRKAGGRIETMPVVPTTRQ